MSPLEPFLCLWLGYVTLCICIILCIHNIGPVQFVPLSFSPPSLVSSYIIIHAILYTSYLRATIINGYKFLAVLENMRVLILAIFNPRCACAARVMVVGSVCVCVCLSVCLPVCLLLNISLLECLFVPQTI